MSMPTPPQALIASANALVPLVASLTAKGDDASLALAAKLQRGINQTLDTATDLNADAAIALLQHDAAALARLKKLTAQAQDAAHAIAKDETRAQSAIAFCSAAVCFGTAIARANIDEAASALSDMLDALRIM